MASIDSSTNLGGSQIDNTTPVNQTVVNILNLTSFDKITANSGVFSTSLKVGSINVVDLSSSQSITNKDLTSATNSFPSTLATKTGTETLTNKMIHHQVGTATDPSISFVGGVGFNDMGFYRVSSGIIGITTSGTQRATISDTLISSSIPVRATVFQATSGNWPECAYGNSTNTQTGLYFGTTTTCGINCNGVTKMTFGSSSNTSFQQLTLADGASNNLALNFNSASSTGFFYAGSNRLGIVAGGAILGTLASTQFLINQNCTVQNGTVAQPSLNFTGETTSGWCRNASGDLRCCIAGSASLGVQSGGIFLYGSLSGNNSSYVASKFSYYQEETINNFTWTFGSNTQTSTAQITRLGRLVKFSIDGDVIQTPSGAIYGFSSTSAIPVQYRPTSQRKVGFPAMIAIGGTFTNAYFGQINTDGTFQFTNINYTTSLASHTLYAFSWSWHISP